MFSHHNDPILKRWKAKIDSFIINGACITPHPDLINEGTEGFVYKLSDSAVVKIFKQKDLETYDILSSLKNSPYFPNVLTSYKHDKLVITDYINGIPLDEVTNAQKIKCHVRKQIKDLILDALDKGYFPQDLNSPGNLLLFNNQVYCVDVGFFVRFNIPKLYHEMVSELLLMDVIHVENPVLLYDDFDHIKAFNLFSAIPRKYQQTLWRLLSEGEGDDGWFFYIFKNHQSKKALKEEVIWKPLLDTLFRI